MIASMRSALSGTLRKDGRWVIVVTLTTLWGAKVRKTLYGKSQREVQAKAHDLIAENPQRKAPSGKTVSDLLDYCESEVWSKLGTRTREQYTGARKRIEARFGKAKVEKVDTPAIYRWIQDMDREGLGGRTIQVHRNVLRVALKEAMFLGWIKHNPAAGWVIPVKVKPAPEPVLTAAQLAAYIEAEKDVRHRAWLMTLWETGARPQEATRLASLHLTRREGYGWWIDIPGTKTAAAARSVPVSDDLAQTLLDLPEPWFPYDRNSWTANWYRLQTSMGLREKRTEKARGKALGPLPRLYAIRKARISAWGDLGLSDAVWAKLAGHEDADLTRRVYDRVSIERIAAQMGIGMSGQYVKNSALGEPDRKI